MGGVGACSQGCCSSPPRRRDAVTVGIMHSSCELLAGTKTGACGFNLIIAKVDDLGVNSLAAGFSLFDRGAIPVGVIRGTNTHAWGFNSPTGFILEVTETGQVQHGGEWVQA